MKNKYYVEYTFVQKEVIKIANRYIDCPRTEEIMLNLEYDLESFLNYYFQTTEIKSKIIPEYNDCLRVYFTTKDPLIKKEMEKEGLVVMQRLE